MALMQELTNRGRVIAGHMEGSDVNSSKHGLTASGVFKRQHINDETVVTWKEIRPDEGFLQKGGIAAIGAVVPGKVGKALGASLGASTKTGHMIQIKFADGKESIIELPNKLFSVLKTLLHEKEIPTDQIVAEDNFDEPQGIADQMVGVASQLVNRMLQRPASEESKQTEADISNAMEQLQKLASLHQAGILTDNEFSSKKIDLLNRL